jgi:hypothetical protein
MGLLLTGRLEPLPIPESPRLLRIGIHHSQPERPHLRPPALAALPVRLLSHAFFGRMPSSTRLWPTTINRLH